METSKITVAADWKDIDGLIDQFAEAFETVGGFTKKDSDGRTWFSTKAPVVFNEMEDNWMRDLFNSSNINAEIDSDMDIDDEIIPAFDALFEELGYDVVEDENMDGSDEYGFIIVKR